MRKLVSGWLPGERGGVGGLEGAESGTSAGTGAENEARAEDRVQSLGGPPDDDARGRQSSHHPGAPLLPVQLPARLSTHAQVRVRTRDFCWKEKPMCILFQQTRATGFASHLRKRKEKEN